MTYHKFTRPFPPKPTHRKFKDLEGLRFGTLVVLELAGRSAGKGQIYWLCRCDCGRESFLRGSYLLRAPKTVSCSRCGKQKIKTHGLTRTKVYRTWCHMKERCLNPNTYNYADYGGRGITMAEEWMSFEAFYRDMGEPPSSKHSIDRIDNDGNYEPSNCRWADISVQSNNRRNNVYIEWNGRRQTVDQWAREMGIRSHTLNTRLRKGWP